MNESPEIVGWSDRGVEAPYRIVYILWPGESDPDACASLVVRDRLTDADLKSSRRSVTQWRRSALNAEGALAQISKLPYTATLQDAITLALEALK